MLKNITSLTHIVEGRAYNFLCDIDSPLNHVKEALFQFQKYIGQIEDYVKEQQASAEAPAVDEPPKEATACTPQE